MENINKEEWEIEGKELKRYLGTSEEISIPDGIESIDRFAFDSYRDKEHPRHIKKLTIPRTVSTVPGGLFHDIQIEEVVLEEGVRHIGENAFWNSEIQKLTLPSSIICIWKYAFSDCNLTELTLNEGIEDVKYGAFFNNPLTRIVIPKSLSRIVLNSFNSLSRNPSPSYQNIICHFSHLGYIHGTIHETTTYNFYVLVDQDFNYDTVCNFIKSIIGKNLNVHVNQITLIGYQSRIQLARLKKLARSAGIEITMTETMDEDLKRKLYGSKLPSNMKDLEIEKLVNGIQDKCAVLEESLKKEVLSKVDDLIKKYKNDLEALRPDLEKSKNSLKTYQTPQSLKLWLLSELQGIHMNFINLDENIYLKEKIEKYKKIVYSYDQAEPKEVVESIEDKIEWLQYYAFSMDQDNIIDELFKILKEIESHILIPSLDIVLPKANALPNLEQELEHRIDDLYQKAKEAYQLYQSLLLLGNNDTSLGRDMKTLNEIINSLDEKSKKDYQERIKKIKVKYLIEVKKLKIEMDSELKIREDLAPILEDLKELIPNMKGKKGILDDINEARKVIQRSKNQRMDSVINELSNILCPILFESSTLNDVFKWKVEELLQKLSDMDRNSTLDEKKGIESIKSMIADIQSLIRGNQDLLKNNREGKFSSDLIRNRLANIISDYNNKKNILLPVEIDEKKAGAITSTMRDILSTLENPVFDETLKERIETSLLHILDESNQQIINDSLVIEEREDSVTKNLDWNSRATLQILRKFYEIENFIDETISYNEDVKKSNLGF